MDSDQGKLFIGGISWETTEDKLRDHFASYGEVAQSVIMRDKLTGRPRGFGFVVFADPSILDRVLLDTHTIDGRTVDAKRALSREEQQAAKAANPDTGRNGGAAAGNFRTKKIFVGGLPPTLTEEAFRQYFQTYGNVTDVVVMIDQNTSRPRGFGFISFDSEDAVDRVLHKTFHDLNGKLVEVKPALPREANPSSGTGRSTSGPYQRNAGSNTNYDGRADANRYLQPQESSGGYPGYGLASYGSTGYGYGNTNPGAGYGNYGYGGASTGYGGPAGGYGNPNVPPGAPRGAWSNQAPSGYGSGTYGGSTGYGVGGAMGAPTSQAPGASTGYGNQGYGYGGYGGDGTYGNQGGYGAYGARGGSGAEQGASAGYASTGYPNAGSGYASVGYGGQVNGPSGGPPSYGSGYGGTQPRQA